MIHDQLGDCDDRTKALDYKSTPSQVCEERKFTHVQTKIKSGGLQFRDARTLMNDGVSTRVVICRMRRPRLCDHRSILDPHLDTKRRDVYA